MTEFGNFERPEVNPEAKKFEVEKYATRGEGNGFVYVIYFPTEEDAAAAVKAFWSERNEGKLNRHFDSGMWDPTKHTLTSGDRTLPRQLFEEDKQKHLGMSWAVEFNGNTGPLHEKGVAALIKLGFIE